MASKTETPAKAADQAPMKSDEKKWWRDGVRFECQGSGKCCVSRGEFGFVYLTDDDRKRMAKVLKMSLSKFTHTYCDLTEGVYHLIEGDRPECLFLHGAKCGVYEARPTQCRTWPFWPEVMTAKAWKSEVAAFCPGIGKGRLYTAPEIKNILEEQRRSEAAL